MPYLNHNIPPFSAYIRNEYLFNHTKGHGDFTFADVHTVNCMERRAILFECLLPNGVNWTRRPINAFVWKKDIVESEQLPLDVLELWDAFSYEVQVWKKVLLANCDVDIMLKGGGKMKGEYLFSIDSCHSDLNTTNLNLSEVPEEHKQFNFGKLENGQFFAQPNNRMLWYEQSSTPAEEYLLIQQLGFQYVNLIQVETQTLLLATNLAQHQNGL